MIKEQNSSVSTTPVSRCFLPQWRGPLEGYAVNVLKRTYPKLSHAYEFSDLYQEAFIVYLNCRRRYVKVDNARWFMALFKLSLGTKLIDLMKAQNKNPVTHALEDETAIPLIDWNEGLLAVSKIPQDIIDTINVLARLSSDVTNTLAIHRARIILEEALL